MLLTARTPAPPTGQSRYTCADGSSVCECRVAAGHADGLRLKLAYQRDPDPRVSTKFQDRGQYSREVDLELSPELLRRCDIAGITRHAAATLESEPQKRQR